MSARGQIFAMVAVAVRRTRIPATARHGAESTTG